jgi:hypothetical protein
MTKYIEKERARYWPVSRKLLAQYTDGTHTDKNRDGSLAWKKNGQLHRLNNKPAFISRYGGLAWKQNGKEHRDEDQPAWIYGNGSLLWYQNGEQHRFHGPAEIWVNGELGWWVNGENITHEVNAWLEGEEWRGTPEQITEFQLRFS